MSTFACNVVKIDSVDHHPNADRLSLVQIGGYTCISAKLANGSHRYNAGDWVVYIPEAAILPEWLLKQMDFWKDDKGTLAGSNGNRVKAMRLRGIFSQGVLYQLRRHRQKWILKGDNDRIKQGVRIGEDVGEVLGVVKYEPPIPTSMSGEVTSLFGKTVKFDVENHQRYPHVFQPGEPVVATEKLHGTFAAFCYWPGLNNPELLNGEWFAYSKGLGSQGLVFKNNEANATNLYQRFLATSDLHRRITALTDESAKFGYEVQPVTILGEIFGQGVQDLAYGQKTPSFRMFDVYAGDPGNGRWLTWEELELFSNATGIELVPLLYNGPYDEAALVALRDGKDSISNSNVREGIVIKSTTNRTDIELGRAMLKMVSPDYLLRKNGTEYN